MHSRSGEPRYSNVLFTDLYELTMAQAYWRAGAKGEAVFSLFFRSYPPDRAYYVSAGLADVLQYLEEFGFSDEDLAYLGGTGQFHPAFLTYLRELRFTGAVRAIPEGHLFFSGEPVLEVTAPIVEAQLIETYALNQISLQSLLATKASRVVHAARGRTVVDFAARRTHGTDAADKLARVAYLVGFAATSNVRAGARYGIPTSGTMAHSFICSFPHEIDAFRAYAATFPDSSVLLVDTYDTLRGVHRAVEVAKEMRREGHKLRSIRLDSGDLLELSRKSRHILDDAGFPEVGIFASGGLDEFQVEELLTAGAPIDGFGVGTKVGVSADAPWTDCAYKLVAYDGKPVLKLSTGKRTLPGPQQVFREFDPYGKLRRDTVGTADEPPSTSQHAVLETVMTMGRRTGAAETLSDLRTRFADEFAALPDVYKRLRAPAAYPVSVSQRLTELTAATTERVRASEGMTGQP